LPRQVCDEILNERPVQRVARSIWPPEIAVDGRCHEHYGGGDEQDRRYRKSLQPDAATPRIPGRPVGFAYHRHLGVQHVDPLTQGNGADLRPVGSGIGSVGALPALPLLICPSLSCVRPVERAEQPGEHR
jgi:hypothetical protein